MKHSSLLALVLLLLLLPACDRAGLRNGHRPGDVEVTDQARIFHLADAVFIEERRIEGKVHFLIESTVADYQLTEKGLDVELEGDMAGTYSTTPAPQGYVAAWITRIPGEGPELTRFQLDDATLAALPEDLTAATTVQDIYDLKQ